MEECPFCLGFIDSVRNEKGFSVDCKRCGRFQISRLAHNALRGEKLDPREKANISGWLIDNEGTNVTREKLKVLRKLVTPSFHDRADKILIAIEKKTKYAGEFIKKEKSWISIGWCLSDAELKELLDYLVVSGKIISEKDIFSTTFKITPKGREHLEKVKKINLNSQQGFVAMWFDNGLTEIYDKIVAEGIRDAGYKPHRIDKKEHNNKIDDEIISEIRRSRFLLADFTGHRGGVYYEAGFAQGLGIDVIWTCRKDHMEGLHFDIRQYNCIEWEQDKLEEFRKRIAIRIESVLGRGTYTIT